MPITRSRRRLAPVAALVAGAALTFTAPASWVEDPAANTVIGEGASDQVQPKIRPTSGGGCYISWFNGIGGGYDVRLQRLDENGVEQWAHNGVLVADRSFSSTQDYDLAVDADDHALLAFRDDRSGQVKVTATRIRPDGTADWGPTGVQLTDGTLFVAAPKIVATSTGVVVVAWTEDDHVGVQQLDIGGGTIWGPNVISDAGGDVTASDLVASTDGAVIVSMVRGFLGPKHLLAQKLSAIGASQWGFFAPIPVFDGAGSLQFGNFPQFVSDGAGGAVFAWYEVSPLQCRVQHILSSGAEAFAHNGVVTSTNATRIRVSPSVDYLPATSEIVVFWTEQNTLQSQHGIYGQKIDAAGNRMWTNDGLVVVPVDGTERTQVLTLAAADGAVVLFVDKPAPPFGQRVLAARVDGTGAFVWTGGILEVSSLEVGKSRLDARLSPCLSVLAAWSDARVDSADVYAQNLSLAGDRGGSVARPGDVDRDCDTDFADLLAVLSAWGPCPPGGPCPADQDGDLVVGFSDLLIVLTNWG